MKWLWFVGTFLVCLIAPVMGNGFTLHHLEAYPSQIYVIWSQVEGADYYDLYLDRVPIQRVDGGMMAFIGSEEEPLESQRSYEIMIVARAQGNKDLSYLVQRITTPIQYTEKFTILAAHPWQNQIDLFWTKIKDAEYYDLYLDRVPVKRIWDGHGTTLGSNEEPLVSRHTYEVMIVARREGDIQVAVDVQHVTTTGWEGCYRWINETKKDNKGLARQLDFRVTSVNDSYRIEGLYDRWHTIFPLVSPTQIGQSFAYDGNGVVQQAYRQNVQVFNTSKIRPDTWSVTSSWEGPASMGIEVRSRAKGITVSTRTTYVFVLDAGRRAQLHFETSADGIAALSIFRSPNSGENGVFKAKQI